MKKVSEEDRPGFTGRTRAVLLTIPAAKVDEPPAGPQWSARSGDPSTPGLPLRAGEIILSGSLGPVIPAAPGDRFTAEIGGLGTVTAQFS